MSIPLALNSCTISLNLEALPPPFSFTPLTVLLGVAKSVSLFSSPCFPDNASVSSPSVKGSSSPTKTFSQADGEHPFALRSSTIILPFLQIVGVVSSIFRFSGSSIKSAHPKSSAAVTKDHCLQEFSLLLPQNPQQQLLSTCCCFTNFKFVLSVLCCSCSLPQTAAISATSSSAHISSQNTASRMPSALKQPQRAANVTTLLISTLDNPSAIRRQSTSTLGCSLFIPIILALLGLNLSSTIAMAFLITSSDKTTVVLPPLPFPEALGNDPPPPAHQPNHLAPASHYVPALPPQEHFYKQLSLLVCLA
nr:hypothetical protein Iba_chr04dCG19600 [Ipomoea batatas]